MPGHRCGAHALRAGVCRRDRPVAVTNPRIATADNGETAVVWQAAAGVQAAIGTPGKGYSAPVTITASGFMPTVV